MTHRSKMMLAALTPMVGAAVVGLGVGTLEEQQAYRQQTQAQVDGLKATVALQAQQLSAYESIMRVDYGRTCGLGSPAPGGEPDITPLVWCTPKK